MFNCCNRKRKTLNLCDCIRNFIMCTPPNQINTIEILKIKIPKNKNIYPALPDSPIASDIVPDIASDIVPDIVPDIK